MWGRRRSVLLLALAVALSGAATARAEGVRDDTAVLQAALDRGGSVVIPKLPGGECYRTRGLWVTHDDTMVTSDGACLVLTGRGEARLKTGTGRPIYATAAFFLNRGRMFDPLPARIRISGVRIAVPAPRKGEGVRLDGIDVEAHEVTIDHVSIGGTPTTDVLVGGGTPGFGGLAERITITDNVLTGGTRNVVSVSGPVGLSIERNVVSGARGRGAAGIEVAVADRGQPALDVRVADNRSSANAGPGIVLDLSPKNGAPVFATRLAVVGNTVLGNGRNAPVARRAGIVLAGGQRDGNGQLVLTDNAAHANRGPGILRRGLRLVVAAARNDLRGNRSGGMTGTRASAVSTAAPGKWLPSAAALATAGHDDTAWLQARLDARGGTIFLPALPNGACYATRGLWVSHDDTTITSDGACLVSLGPGDVRLRSFDGDPIASNGVFFINRSSPNRPAPVNVTIENVKIVVPANQSMFGIASFGHQVTLRRLDIGGEPIDDVLIGGRANGNGYAGTVSVVDSTLRGAGRNAVSAFGVFGLRIERNVIEGVRDAPRGQPAAGIDVEPDERSQPTLDVHIVGNTIQDNAGPGVLLSLEPNSGASIVCTAIEISGNTIVRNGSKHTPPVRAGVVISGGQDDGRGTLRLANNVIRDNGGPGLLFSRLRLLVDAVGNSISGNES